MKFRLASDLHLEFYTYKLSVTCAELLDEFIPHLPDDHKTTLLLAGDIASLHVEDADLYAGIERLSNRFHAVVYVPGNHEFYGGSNHPASGKYAIALNANRMLHINKRFPNVTTQVAERAALSVKVAEDVTVVGATLWSYPSDACRRAMNDYRHVDFKLVHQLREAQGNALAELAGLAKAEGSKVVVVTHHLPHHSLIHPDYETNYLNSAYASNTNLLDIADVCCFGHTHKHYKGQANAYANPRGYPGEHDVGYIDNFTFEV